MVDSNPASWVPDLALLRPRADFYATSHPEASDVLLLVEVSDTTLEMDHRIKIPLYARYGIRAAWLLDLTRDRLEVRRHPTAEGYRTSASSSAGSR